MNPSRKMVRWYRCFYNWILDGLIVILLGGMVLLAAAQILMRNLFSYSLFWGDDVLQLALLWLVMSGAVAAARTGEHLRINILAQFIPRAARPWMYAALHVFTAAVCAVLAWQSALLVLESLEYDDTLFGKLPAWAAQLVMPTGFGLLAFHYTVRCLSEVFHGLRRRPPHGSVT
jgi:TRAP-type C4-dicarboxylate transport system permease small subunit